jgi:hypothetical protein
MRKIGLEARPGHFVDTCVNVCLHTHACVCARTHTCMCV